MYFLVNASPKPLDVATNFYLNRPHDLYWDFGQGQRSNNVFSC